MKFRDRLAQFFQGRNGSDQLSRAMSWTSCVLLLVSMFTSSVLNGVLSSVLWYLALIIFGISIFRMLSKNIYKRQAENDKYRAFSSRIKARFARTKQRFHDRKAYKYFKCPSCKATLRVPRGKGNVQITCRKCGHRFSGRT